MERMSPPATGLGKIFNETYFTAYQTAVDYITSSEAYVIIDVSKPSSFISKRLRSINRRETASQLHAIRVSVAESSRDFSKLLTDEGIPAAIQTNNPLLDL